MPLFMVERDHARLMDGVELRAAALAGEADQDVVQWLYSFLSADRRTSFCLFEAPSAEFIHALADEAGLPRAVVVQVDQVGRGVEPVPADARSGKKGV